MTSQRSRQGGGRHKVEVKTIENEEARQVCFSKRRAGLIRKASELSIICGAEIGALIVSPAGKIFTFGHPSLEAVAERFLASDAVARVSPVLVDDQKGVSAEVMEDLAAEKNRKEEMEKALEKARAQHYYWRDTGELDAVDQEELEKLSRSMGRLRAGLAQRAEKLLLEASIARRNGSFPEKEGEGAGASGGGEGPPTR